MARMKIGVLISGRGSNLRSLLAAAARPDYPAEIVQVISNRPEAPGLAYAEDAGVPTEVIDHTAFAGRPGFEAALTASLLAAGVEMVALAGFMRVLTPNFVDAWQDRLINIHPSLLPAFPGLDTHAAALAAGVKVAGCTVHFVREAVDDGPIVGQAAVPVLPEDTPDTLADRVLAAEHELYPHCIRLVASGRARVVGARVVGKRVTIDEGGTPPPVLFNPPLD